MNMIFKVYNEVNEMRFRQWEDNKKPLGIWELLKRNDK